MSSFEHAAKTRFDAHPWTRSDSVRQAKDDARKAEIHRLIDAFKNNQPKASVYRMARLAAKNS